jgi:hypothetical protein
MVRVCWHFVCTLSHIQWDASVSPVIYCEAYTSLRVFNPDPESVLAGAPQR